MSADSISSIRTFIVESFLYGDASAAPADDESLIAAGIIDSTGVLELVAFIEDSFGITVEDAEITPENLDSIDAIALYIQQKSGPSPIAA